MLNILCTILHQIEVGKCGNFAVTVQNKYDIPMRGIFYLSNQ